MVAAAVLVVALVGGPELAAGEVVELPNACPAIPPIVIAAPPPAVDLAPVIAAIARVDARLEHVEADAAAFRDEVRNVWKSLLKQLPVILPIVGGVIAGRAIK